MPRYFRAGSGKVVIKVIAGLAPVIAVILPFEGLEDAVDLVKDLADYSDEGSGLPAAEPQTLEDGLRSMSEVRKTLWWMPAGSILAAAAFHLL